MRRSSIRREGAQASEVAEQAIPERIADRFDVESLLGEGGMGWILQVRDRARDDRLALKLSKPREGRRVIDHEGFLQREYHALEQLAHPRIIRVYDYGVCEQAGPFYTMELLDGDDLRSVAPLPVERACALLRDVASSLAIVHSRRLVHRDVNPRNVRCTSDGRAKLLDFGALTSMGVPPSFVGTPAFVPPEAAYGQPLDQRSDLYSFGVLAYWLLSGRRPYEVRELAELRDAWRTKPRPLATMVPSAPAALDALVMSLMSPNPTGRPQQAAEVIDRLTAIGGLSRDPDMGVVRAYLTTPTLVGRDRQVTRIRKAIVRAARGRGGSIVVQGAPGAGATRMLDACVMEAKLVGALVARVAAGTQSRATLGALRDAVEQWERGLPSAAGDRLREVLDPVEIDEEGGDTQRQDVHARIAEEVLALAGKRALLLAIDDAQRADARSLAVFALLARAAGTHKLLVFSSLPMANEQEDSTPLRMLRSASRLLDLSRWAPEDTAALLRSVFGDVPNATLVADRIHRAARGNPRDTMQLAQHLVDTGVVQYERGSWRLPTQLDEVVLPETMEQAQRQAAAALDAQTRALAVALALAADPSLLDRTRCSRLVEGASARLDELLRCGFLVRHREGFAFRHRAFANALLDGLEPEQRVAAHLTLAETHAACGDDTLTIAYHYHHAGRSEECLDRVRPCLNTDEGETPARHQLAVLELVITDPARYRLTVVEAHLIRVLLLRSASALDPDYARHCGPALERLRKDTGLIFWEEHADLEPAARMSHCLHRAVAKFEATPIAERGLPPVDAIRSLAVVVRSLTSVHARTLATPELASMAAWLEPLRPLAPVLDLLYELTCASADRAAREKRVVHRFLACARRFEDDSLGLEENVRRHAAAACIYCAAMDEAKQGKASALERADRLAEVPSFAALAWQVRMLCHIYAGRTAEAERCRERMELLEVQHVEPNPLLAMSVLYEAWGYEMCEDLVGLQGALRRVEQEADRYPGWRPWAMIYAGDVRRLRGELQEALRDYEQACELTAPGEHLAWPHSVHRRVVALRQLGRLEESLQLARDLVAFAQREDFEPTNVVRFSVACARTETEAEHYQAAEESLSRAQACLEREAIAGVPVGLVHEARARLAIRRGDAAACLAALHACAERYTTDHGPALTAKYERLLAAAMAAGFGDELAEGQRTSDRDQVRRLCEISDDDARARAMLGLLTEHYGVDDACLFGVSHRGLSSLATVGEVQADEQLREHVDAFLSAELLSAVSVTVTAQDERAAAGASDLWTTGSGQTYFPVMLAGSRDGVDLVAGVAMLRMHDRALRPAASDLLRTLGEALLASGQVSGMRAEA
ncbi:MAG: protein kinase [Myxococcales bacterium]|nr:protein kinase [Myxococcales bacterium]